MRDRVGKMREREEREIIKNTKWREREREREKFLDDVMRIDKI